MSDGRSGRRRRADGEESRRRILDAAAEIAGERGYEGTSIATVSARSGLPASSIYWHFQDKDALIAAVIERSFERWLAAMSLPGPEAGSPRERMTAMAVARGEGAAGRPRLPAPGTDARPGAPPDRAHRPREVPAGAPGRRPARQPRPSENWPPSCPRRRSSS